MKRGRILARVVWAALTLLGASLIVFFMAHAVPADPAAAFAGPHADRTTRERIRRELGLDRPVMEQYLRYISKAARGDLGRSYVTQERITDAILVRFPTTAAVALGGLAVWLAVGVPVGVVTARKRDTALDRWVLILAMVGISVPTFWLGRMLQFHLAYRAGVLPVAGLASWAHLILPCLTLGAVGVGYYARFVHSCMVEALGQDYVRSARAKGASEAKVLFRHALPNALIPILTMVGMDLAALLGGVVFTETVFALPGVGALSVQAVLNLDVPMIMGTVLFSAALVVASNLAVDLLYGAADPRLKAG